MHSEVILDLLTVSDVNLAWELVRRDVVKQLTGRDAEPVPALSEARDYDLWEVLAKERLSLLHRLRGYTPIMHHTGLLPQLLAPPGVSEQMHIEDIKEYEDTMYLDQDFCYELCKDRLRDNKLIRVEIKGCRRVYSNYGIYQHLLRLNMDVPLIKDAKYVFVITEVYRANQVQVTTSVGQEEKHWLLRGPVPVAFIMHKHQLGPRAELLPAKSIKPKQQKCCCCFSGYRHPQDLTILPKGISSKRRYSIILKDRLMSALKCDTSFKNRSSHLKDDNLQPITSRDSYKESTEKIIKSEEIHIEMNSPDPEYIGASNFTFIESNSAG